MPHLMPDLRHGIVIRRNLAVEGALRKLVRVGDNVMIARIFHVSRRILVHLVRAHVNRLHKLPLEPSLAAVACQVSLMRGNARYFDAIRTAAEWPSAGSSRIGLINAEIRVVGQ